MKWVYCSLYVITGLFIKFYTSYIYTNLSFPYPITFRYYHVYVYCYIAFLNELYTQSLFSCYVYPTDQWRSIELCINITDTDVGRMNLVFTSSL